MSKNMVDPKCFVARYMRYATSESIDRAMEIQREFNRQKNFWRSNEPTWLYMTMIGAIYEAGRTQGIREERHRRHK